MRLCRAERNCPGFIFEDANGNGLFDKGEKGIANASMSNGRDLVLTEADGAYKLPVNAIGEIFVIKPAGYPLLLNDMNLPQYYYLYRPQGSPETQYPGIVPTGKLPKEINFALIPQDEQVDFSMLLFGHTQARERSDARFFSLFGHQTTA